MTISITPQALFELENYVKSGRAAEAFNPPKAKAHNRGFIAACIIEEWLGNPERDVTPFYSSQQQAEVERKYYYDKIIDEWIASKGQTENPGMTVHDFTLTDAHREKYGPMPTSGQS